MGDWGEGDRARIREEERFGVDVEVWRTIQTGSPCPPSRRTSRYRDSPGRPRTEAGGPASTARAMAGTVGRVVAATACLAILGPGAVVVVALGWAVEGWAAKAAAGSGEAATEEAAAAAGALEVVGTARACP